MSHNVHCVNLRDIVMTCASGVAGQADEPSRGGREAPPGVGVGVTLVRSVALSSGRWERLSGRSSVVRGWCAGWTEARDCGRSAAARVLLVLRKDYIGGTGFSNVHL